MQKCGSVLHAAIETETEIEMLWEVGYPPPILVILEDGVVIFYIS